MNLTEYLAKWQELTERQRDILTALALRYRLHYYEAQGHWALLNAEGYSISKHTWEEAHNLWNLYCPYFTRFDPDCGAFVEVWDRFRRLSSESYHQSRIAFGQEWRQSAKESCNAYHFWMELSDNPADALCCAYVWARLEEKPELWEKFEEAIG